ncbi:hypothetical protein ILYODFUR_035988 [Ilyodon furcidens]|uniref:Uncharacterized protein n=1 Tax=Ilyodon furcidens TaxID=33524 RepID=A0ABV0TFR6_9TELE
MLFSRCVELSVMIPHPCDLRPRPPSLLLLRWITPAGSLLIPSFLGSPSTNPVHPPPSTAPTSETLGPTKHPGTPVFTISCLKGKQPLGLSTPLWWISPSI